MSSEQFKLTWLHLSDIHFGHGGSYARAERHDVLRTLAEDVRTLEGKVPKIDQLIVSGDVAHSGGSLSEEEYDEARDYLERLAGSLGLGNEAVFLIPGNHDIDRGVAERDGDVRRWLHELREGRPVDEAVASPEDRERLEVRFANYMEFAQDFGSGFESSTSARPLFWSTVIEARTDLRVRIAGGNTALLCQDDEDHGKLQIGLSQLREILRPDAGHDVAILVTHHPLDWLRDYRDIEPRVRRWADLHLCGHVHEPESETRMRGGGGEIVRIVAGAAHEFETGRGRGTGSFSYSVASLYTDDQDDLWVRLWPRRWTPAHAAFRVDPASVPDGHSYVDHRLARRTIRKSPNAAVLPSGLVPDRATQRLWSASERSVRRIGARRTAYPLDMSIAELHKRGLYVPATLTNLTDERLKATVESLSNEVQSGRSVLILGEPGSGKSVTAYALLENLRRRIPAIALRVSDLPDVATDQTGGSELAVALRQARDAGFSDVVVLVDGLDETLGEFDTSADLSRLLDDVSARHRIIVTCRRREFEDQLARVIGEGIFDTIYVLDEWTLDGEFAEFVKRLVSSDLLDSTDIVDTIRNSTALSSMAKRPLFARMLTFLGHRGVPIVDSVGTLYAEYIDKLSAASDTALKNANCVAPVPSRSIWVEAAWTIFSKGLLTEERFSIGAATTLVGAKFGLHARCLLRSLSQLCDQWRVAGRVWGRFVHYSFFEYLVAAHYLEQVNSSILQNSATDLADALGLDLTPEIRHFLVDELRSAHLPRLTEALAAAYAESKLLRVEPPRVRTIGNLIAYLLSRAAPRAQQALSDLLKTETDMFLQQSLLWGLCHIGDESALERFILESRRSNDWRALNRGYLMYYYGDLDRREDPPFVDADRRRGWGRTRERSIALMSTNNYSQSITAQRRFLDLYSLYDYAIWRGQKLPERDASVAAEVLAALWRETQIPNSLLLELQAMHAACGE